MGGDDSRKGGRKAEGEGQRERGRDEYVHVSYVNSVVKILPITYNYSHT